MRRLKAITADFLTDTGNLSKAGPRLGQPEPAATSAAPNAQDQVKRFTDRLFDESKRNSNISVVAAGLYVLLFLVCVGFAVYYRDKPVVMGSVLGGSFLGLSAIIVGLRNLWREKAGLDLMVFAVQGLSAQEVVELAKVVYFADLTKAPPKPGGPA